VKTGVENLGGDQTNCTREGRDQPAPRPGADLRSAAARVATAIAGSGAKGAA